MQPARPSHTALRVALRRAAHQFYDAPPLVLDDPIAIPILGPQYAEELGKTASKLHKPFSVALRAFLIARSRYAEDTLAAAVAHGITQYVLLGAGLDTFAYRNPYPHLHVFEVDRPATQQWKLELLDRSNIPIPSNLTYVPIDFEHETLPEQLQAAGFNPQLPTFFAWLGVVPYLSESAVFAALGFVASLPGGGEVVFDYANPPETIVDEAMRRAHEVLAARVATAAPAP